ncbi:MAG: GTP pyrophosphokinase [Ruminiclostridium sp.]|nr:GTP pyrophosphokinase [Ruminiclostridium sp.]
MMDLQTFLTSYNLDEAALREAGVSPQELALIEQEYQAIEGTLREIGKSFIDEYLYEIDTAGIHSYRYRTKETEHVLEKVIRKRRENPEKFRHLDHTNFHKYITDLIGIRVLFLYREDWVHFHRYITSKFENDPSLYIQDRLKDFDENPDHYYLAERPKAYKRTGDSKIYDGDEIEIITDGIYRSLHYIIKYKGYYVEIQGRTLFEEGWSEIDHDIVYKEAQDDEMLRDYSRLLNRLSGLADEMSSYFRRMKHQKEPES